MPRRRTRHTHRHRRLRARMWSLRTRRTSLALQDTTRASGSKTMAGAFMPQFAQGMGRPIGDYAGGGRGGARMSDRHRPHGARQSGSGRAGPPLAPRGSQHGGGVQQQVIQRTSVAQKVDLSKAANPWKPAQAQTVGLDQEDKKRAVSVCHSMNALKMLCCSCARREYADC